MASRKRVLERVGELDEAKHEQVHEHVEDVLAGEREGDATNVVVVGEETAASASAPRAFADAERRQRIQQQESLGNSGAHERDGWWEALRLEGRTGVGRFRAGPEKVVRDEWDTAADPAAVSAAAGSAAAAADVAADSDDAVFAAVAAGPSRPTDDALSRFLPLVPALLLPPLLLLLLLLLLLTSVPEQEVREPLHHELPSLEGSRGVLRIVEVQLSRLEQHPGRWVEPVPPQKNDAATRAAAQSEFVR